jgi:hypothetical protein
LQIFDGRFATSPCTTFSNSCSMIFSIFIVIQLFSVAI